VFAAAFANVAWMLRLAHLMIFEKTVKYGPGTSRRLA